MLTGEAAGLIVKAAKGAIKLSHRIDLVQAERVAVEAPMALPVPDVELSPTQPQMVQALRTLLEETKDDDPDPLGAERGIIDDAITTPVASNAELFALMQTYAPEQARGRIIDLNSDFVRELQKARPDWADDPDIIVASTYVYAGEDERRKGYTWRIALTVIDTLAEFGGENSALFTRDPRLQSVVEAVLRRFGEADVQKTDSNQALIRVVLAATLNGVLDSKADLGIRNPALEALFDGVLKARSTLPEGEQDDFVVGLLRGTGYPLLVGNIMEQSAGLLGADDVTNLKDIAGSFLVEVGGVIKQQPAFADFFRDHWADLLRAGLTATEKHGPALLNGSSPLLQDILVGIVGSLKTRPSCKLLSTESLVGIVDATASVVAANPEGVDDLISSGWLSTFVSSLTTTVADQGIRATFTDRGLETLVNDTLRTFADRPELLVDNPGLARDLLRGVLTSVSKLDTFSAQLIASAAIGGSLRVISDNPEIVKGPYAEVLGVLAEKVSVLVGEGRLSNVQGSDILAALTETLVENPKLFLEVEKALAGTVLEVTVSVAGASGGLVSGATLVKTVHEVEQALASTGNAALKNQPLADLAAEVEKLLNAGLSRAARELGNQMTLSGLPATLGGLVRAWARGEIANLDPDNDNFRRLFAELAGRPHLDSGADQ